MRKARTGTSKKREPKSNVRMLSIRMSIVEAKALATEMERGIVRDRKLCYAAILKLARWGGTWKKQAQAFREKFNFTQGEFYGQI